MSAPEINQALKFLSSSMNGEEKKYFNRILEIGDHKFTEDVFSFLSGRTPLIFMTCNEEKRLVEYFKLAGLAKGTSVFTWDISRGIKSIGVNSNANNLQDVVNGEEEDNEGYDEEDVLDHILKIANEPEKSESSSNGSVFLLLDYHRYLEEDSCLPSVERKLKNISLAKGRVSVFLIGPQYTTTKSLDSYMNLMDFPYPSEKEISNELNKMAKGVVAKIPSIVVDLKNKKEDIVNACSGMTIQDANAAMSHTIVKNRSFEIKSILNFKRQTIRKAGILEFVDTNVTLDDVGGLGPLVDWFKNRKIAMSDEAVARGIDPVRGALLVGVPGCGKSLAAKAVAAEYRFPLLKLDFGSLFSSLQGDTEHRLREAIKLAEAISPCVLWCDEIEKGTSGTKSSNETDGGTTARVMQYLLTWMQEKTAPVFLIGTANNHEALAPEFLRRFDEIWFVDNPSNVGRKQIFEIQLKSRNIDYSNFDLGKLVERTDKYNGDEIRKIVNESLLVSIRSKSKVTMESLLTQINSLKPLSEKKSEDIKAIRKWAKENCGIANDPDVFEENSASEDEGYNILG
jgi:SpoVK/Ycf46/Vps4 family AAA+-type ATPase